MILLTDIDDVIADWSRGVDEELDAQCAPAAIPRKSDRTTFNMHHNLAPEHSAIVNRIMLLPNFYARLHPIEGALEALDRLAKQHEVLLVSTPWAGHETCASEKVGWVRRHLGPEWERRVVLTHDKTLVHGDVLIDDRPVITGRVEPSWTRVVFDMPWNAETPGFRMHGWSEVDDVLAEATIVGPLARALGLRP